LTGLPFVLNCGFFYFANLKGTCSLKGKNQFQWLKLKSVVINFNEGPDKNNCWRQATQQIAEIGLPLFC
jgi:hypothetical protein